MLQGRVHPKIMNSEFWWILRTFWPSIDSNETGTRFKAQKRSKDIVKIVHVTSLVQPEFDETTRILFVHKENKNNDFIQQFFSYQCQSVKHIHNSITTHFLY